MSHNYWLFKSEPDVFSIDDLAASPNATTYWDGVRNYQARNMLRDQISQGDWVLFYHSNANPKGVAGTARVVREGYPDHTQFEPESDYYDPKASQDKPRWFMVDIRFEEKFPHVVTLQQMRATPELGGMPLLKKGQRLSIQPVTEQQWQVIRALGQASKS